MEKKVYENLLKSKALRDNDEIGVFEENLERLAETFTEADIVELCSVFDDETHDVEVMFGMIHLMETLSTDSAYYETMVGVSKMKDTAPGWARAIVYRCLNDEYSVGILKGLYSKLPDDVKEGFTLVLESIRAKKGAQFGKTIDEIIA